MLNPATGELLETLIEHPAVQVWNAFATGDKAFRTWAAHPPNERSKIIGTSAQILLQERCYA